MINIIILVMLILVNAFFAGSEIALISVNKNKIVLMAEDGNKTAKVVLKLVDKPTRLLSMIQIGVTLSGFLNSALAADVFADDLASALSFLGLNPATMRSISMIIITIALTFVTLIFGELVPKRIAMNAPEKFAFKIAYPISILNKLVSPFVSFLSILTNLILRIVGIDPNKDTDSITEEEIRLMVASSSGEGSIRDTEKEMIDNIFEFDDTSVDEVMTHRTEINALRIDTGFDDVLEYVNSIASSRIPVFEDSLDNIVGVLHVKDLLRSISSKNENEFVLKDILREPLFVPDSQSIEKLFNELKSENKHIAIVIDEYGGTCGIVTMEDLLEEIVGEVFDEYDEVPFEYKRITPNKYIMDGSMELDATEKVLGIDMPVDDYDTLNGFIIAQIGRLPNMNDNSSFEFEGYTFKIVKVDDKVVEKVMVERKGDTSDDDEKDDEK